MVTKGARGWGGANQEFGLGSCKVPCIKQTNDRYPGLRKRGAGDQRLWFHSFFPEWTEVKLGLHLFFPGRREKRSSLCVYGQAARPLDKVGLGGFLLVQELGSPTSRVSRGVFQCFWLFCLFLETIRKIVPLYKAENTRGWSTSNMCFISSGCY